MTRSSAPPPPGRLTLKQAARRSKLSYGQVYRRVVTNQEVPSQWHPELGCHTIAAEDVHLLKPYVATVDTRPGVTIKVSHEEMAAWRKAAGKRSVSQWLLGMARAASGWER